ASDCWPGGKDIDRGGLAVSGPLLCDGQSMAAAGAVASQRCRRAGERCAALWPALADPRWAFRAAGRTDSKFPPDRDGRRGWRCQAENIVSVRLFAVALAPD